MPSNFILGNCLGYIEYDPSVTLLLCNTKYDEISAEPTRPVILVCQIGWFELSFGLALELMA